MKTVRKAPWLWLFLRSELDWGNESEGSRTVCYTERPYFTVPQRIVGYDRVMVSILHLSPPILQLLNQSISFIRMTPVGCDNLHPMLYEFCCPILWRVTSRTTQCDICKSYFPSNAMEHGGTQERDNYSQEIKPALHPGEGQLGLQQDDKDNSRQSQCSGYQIIY